MILTLRSLSQARRRPAVPLATAFALGAFGATAIGSMSHGLITVAAPPPPLTRPPTALPEISVRYSAEIVRVIDGDTFEARVRVWPGLEVSTKVRLRGIDAPELRARCAEERMRGEAARDALAALLARGPVGISQVNLDKYGGRVVADASTRSGTSIADALVTAGHARRYDGGRRQGWCAGRAS